MALRTQTLCLLLLILLPSCLTEMAHKYTFSEEYNYVYFRNVTGAALRGTRIAVCAETGSDPVEQVLAAFEVGPDHRLSTAPFDRYSVDFSERALHGPCPGTRLAPVALGKSALLLPKGIVLELPPDPRGSIPVLLDTPNEQELDGIDGARLVPKTRAILLMKGGQAIAQLDRIARSGVPKPYRSTYLYGDIHYYSGGGLVTAEAGQGRPLTLRRLGKHGNLLVYFRSAGGRLDRRAFALPRSGDRLTLLLPYQSRSEIGFRPWGLCLYPPAIIGDILTGIIQAILFYEDIRRGTCT